MLAVLAFDSGSDACGYGEAAECWTLAPWRGRTVPRSAWVSGRPAFSSPSPSATPNWAFAPPMGESAAKTAAKTTAPPADRAGCWAFSPFTRCATTG
ncbi:hypothetical protein ACFHYQ_05820 [Sphaerimonospora cavernae]|uniref:Uncharacterized protein n=1 Tax=Sphaerimonospora cavernae TaxID=1740611 RepID=A0ABV6U030_9ACTN